MERVDQRGSGAHRAALSIDDRGIDSSPTRSPTGREIAFTSDRGGSPQIFVMDSEGGNVRRLDVRRQRTDSPAWSPKGDRIAYVSRVEGKFSLMLFDLQSQRSTVLMSGPFNCEDPRWSYDAKHLTFASDREGNGHLHHRHRRRGTSGASRRALRASLRTGRGDRCAIMQTFRALLYVGRARSRRCKGGMT